MCCFYYYPRNWLPAFQSERYGQAGILQRRQLSDLGQSENFIAYKDILGKMSRNRMYTMAATAMSTVSMSIVGAYMTMLEPKYVVAALVLNMFSTFIVLSLINPYRVDASEENIQMSNLHEGQSFFEMLGEYIWQVSKWQLSLRRC